MILGAQIVDIFLFTLHHIDPTSTPHRPYIDLTPTPHRPHIDPISTPQRPYIDPTSTLHQTHIDLTSTLYRPYIDPTSTIDPRSTLHRPHIDPTSTLHRPHIDLTSTPYRHYIDPTSTLHRPHIDLTLTLCRPHIDLTSTPYRLHIEPISSTFIPYTPWIGEFRIPGRARTSSCFCAKARLMRITSHQEDKQTWENCGWVAEKKENLKRWKVLEVSKTCFQALEIIAWISSDCFESFSPLSNVWIDQLLMPSSDVTTIRKLGSDFDWLIV